MTRHRNTPASDRTPRPELKDKLARAAGCATFSRKDLNRFLRAAQFLQVEHGPALFVDLNTTSPMPLMGDEGASGSRPRCARGGGGPCPGLQRHGSSYVESVAGREHN